MTLKTHLKPPKTDKRSAFRARIAIHPSLGPASITALDTIGLCPQKVNGLNPSDEAYSDPRKGPTQSSEINGICRQINSQLFRICPTHVCQAQCGASIPGGYSIDSGETTIEWLVAGP
jgi:hypothetical protein